MEQSSGKMHSAGISPIRGQIVNRLRKGMKRQSPMLATVAPVSLWLLLLVAIPLLYVLVLSFLSRDANGNVVFRLTLENYAKLLNTEYLRIYGMSLLVAFTTTIVSVLLAYPFAYHMANGSDRKKVLLMMLVIIPFWTNSLIRLYGWKTLLGASGVVNSLLKSLGLIDKPLELLFNTPAVVLGMVYTLIPFMILPLYTSIEKLDKTLLEAASDLGARRVSTFFEITLPHTAAGIFAGSIMVFIPALGYFFVSDLMGGGNNMLIGNLIKNQFYTARNWPLGAALSIVLIAVTLMLVKLYQKAGGDLDDLGVA